MAAIHFLNQRVVLSEPRPETPPFEATPAYTFAQALVDQRAAGKEASLPELNQLMEEAPKLGRPQLEALEKALGTRGEPTKLKVSEGKKAKTVKLAHEPARFLAKHVGGELGDLNGVEVALSQLDRELWANRGRNDGLRDRRSQLLALRTRYLLGPRQAAKVSPKDEPDVVRVGELVSKRNTSATQLSVDEALEATVLMRDGFTRRQAAQQMIASDGGHLRFWRNEDAGETLELLYPRARVEAELEALGGEHRQAASSTPPQPAVLARLEGEIAKHEQLLGEHDLAEHIGRQGARVIVGAGPALNAVMGGGNVIAGVARSKNTETGLTEWRPTAEVKVNVPVFNGGYVFYPGGGGVSRGLGAGVVNVNEDPLIGTGVQVTLIPAVASATASGRGMVQLDLTLPMPFFTGMQVTVPFTHLELPLVFPLFGMRTRIAVQDPRLAPVAEKINGMRDWMGNAVSRLRRPREPSLPAEFRPHDADRPRRIDAAIGGVAFYSR